MQNSDVWQRMGRVDYQRRALAEMSAFKNPSSLREFQREFKFGTEEKKWL